MKTITVKLKKTLKGWIWTRKGTDKCDGSSYRTFQTPSEALYNAYGFELRGDEDKPITRE
jgi:hypothetical protein